MQENKKPERIMLRVGDKLIPKPDNKRDPKRRYSAVSPLPDFPNESILVEFTDAEERQRDAEEAKWAAEKPQREELAKAERQKFEEFRASIKYENRIVAFLDVLGWKRLIDESVTKPEVVRQMGVLLNALKTINEVSRKFHRDGGPGLGDPQFAQISDSVIFSATADVNGRFALRSFLWGCTHAALGSGLFFRGGISAGQMYHRDSVAYGPALTRAYLLEKDEAKFPRIILDTELAKVWGRGDRIIDKDGELVGHVLIWDTDDDGWSFYDFLQPLTAQTAFSDAFPPALVKGHLSDPKSKIEKAITEHWARPELRPKYAWLAKYFNRVAQQYGDAEIPPIVLPPAP